MVFAGGWQEEEREDSKTTSEARFIMAMGPERSRSLHNFNLPCLKWGSQRQLRCVKVDGDSGGANFRPLDRRSQERKRRSLASTEADEIGRRSAVDCDYEDGIEAVRKKLMLDLQTEMDKMKFAVLSKGSVEIEPPPPPLVDEARPWNLRTRRAACKEPNANQRIDEGNWSLSPARRNDVGEYGGIKRPRAKFSVSLSKHEIEEDFIAIMGTRPARKPKKRPRCVQKQLDTLFPGLLVSEITADMYKVNENPEGGKKVMM